jgi:hypothetical protein
MHRDKCEEVKAEVKEHDAHQRNNASVRLDNFRLYAGQMKDGQPHASKTSTNFIVPVLYKKKENKQSTYFLNLKRRFDDNIRRLGFMLRAIWARQFDSILYWYMAASAW